MAIPFTQYLMPDGEKRSISIDRPAEIEEKAQLLFSEGYHFDIEVLQTGEVSMTVERGEETLSIEVCQNNEEVPKHVDQMVTNAFRRLQTLQNMSDEHASQ